MISTKKELKDCLKIERPLYNVTASAYIMSFFGASEQGLIWRYLKRLRKWEYHLNAKHRLRAGFYHFKTNRIGFRYGLSISPNSFDTGLKIEHLGNILANSQTKVGKNCLLNKNVSFVATGGSNDSPTVGDNCKFGIGSTIIGNVRLGNNVVVGAGAVVTKTFPDNVTIAGVPAKIINH